jgi:hypothetical protein
MSNHNCHVCFNVYMVTCEPCPSKIKRCGLIYEIPLDTNLTKNDNDSVNMKLVIHAFLCTAMYICPCFSNFYVIIFDTFTLEYAKTW